MPKTNRDVDRIPDTLSSDEAAAILRLAYALKFSKWPRATLLHPRQSRSRRIERLWRRLSCAKTRGKFGVSPRFPFRPATYVSRGNVITSSARARARKYGRAQIKASRYARLIKFRPGQFDARRFAEKYLLLRRLSSQLFILTLNARGLLRLGPYSTIV